MSLKPTLKHPKFWTEEEIETLNNYYPTKLREEVLVRLPKRTWSTASAKARELGIRRSFKPPRHLKEYTCQECGKVFYDQPSDNRIFCSKECYVKNIHKKNRTLFERVKKVCPTCGREFEVPLASRNQKFCSRLCIRHPVHIREKRARAGMNKQWLENHRSALFEEIHELGKKGFRCVPLIRPIPDAIIIDFENRKVLALEITTGKRPFTPVDIAVYNNINWYDDILWIRRRVIYKP